MKSSVLNCLLLLLLLLCWSSQILSQAPADPADDIDYGDLNDLFSSISPPLALMSDSSFGSGFTGESIVPTDSPGTEVTDVTEVAEATEVTEGTEVTKATEMTVTNADFLGTGEIVWITVGSVLALLLALLVCLLLACICTSVIGKRGKVVVIKSTPNPDQTFTVVPRQNPRYQVPSDDWELPASAIEVNARLGAGAFGEVYKGFLNTRVTCSKVKPCYRINATRLPVAIKFLKNSTMGSGKGDFLSEIEMMKKVSEGHSPHVVGMLGCVTLQEPHCLVTEFVKYGDLLSYLRTNRKMFITHSSTEEDDPYYELEKFSPLDLISFAYQIAAGINFLANIGIVHRDLACRNILVDEGKKLKIIDFGLSRETEEIYTQKSKSKVPYKWMAIESIIAREFTFASAVWSYGVVLWEIGTIGGFPYPGISNEQLLPRLKEGYRMEKPDNCSFETYEIMLSCWNEDASQRPAFQDLQKTVGHLLAAESGSFYMDFSINSEDPCYLLADEEDPTFSDSSPHSKIQASTQDSNMLENGTIDGGKSSTANSFKRGIAHLPEITNGGHTSSANTDNHIQEQRRPHSMTFLPEKSSANHNKYVKSPSDMVTAFPSPPLAGLPRNNHMTVHMARGKSDGGINKL